MVRIAIKNKIFSGNKSEDEHKSKITKQNIRNHFELCKSTIRTRMELLGKEMAVMHEFQPNYLTGALWVAHSPTFSPEFGTAGYH